MGIFNSVIKRCILFTFLVIMFVFVINASSFAEQTWVLIDDFETHQWKATGWGNDNGSMTYDSSWSPIGDESLKLTVTGASTGTTGWYAWISGSFEEIQSTHIKMDIKVVSTTTRLKVEALDDTGTSRELLAATDFTVGVHSNYEISNSSNYKIRQLRFIIDNYGANQTRTMYIDNIRMKVSGTYSLWDPLEDHVHWDGSVDADCPDSSVARMDDLVQSVQSPNNDSTSCIAIEWDEDVHATDTSATLYITGQNYDWSDYYYFKFDVYRPSDTTKDTKLILSVYDGSASSGTEVSYIEQANTWVTIIVPLWDATCDMSSIDEIKFVILDTDIATSGKLYFDNLYVGGYTPENTIHDPTHDQGDTLYKHIVKDYDDGDLIDNDFYGYVGNVGGDDGTCDQEISTSEYYGASGKSLKLHFDVEESQDSWACYYNTFEKDSDKYKFVIYIKGGPSANNPKRIKLEFHDPSWQTSNYSSGCGYVWISGISSSSWKQWIIDVSEDIVGIVGEFDKTDIREVVLTLDHRKTDGSFVGASAKDIYFWIDELTFFDTSDSLVWYSKIEPETNIIPDNQIKDDQNNTLYKHVLKTYDTSDGIEGNYFNGQNGLGQIKNGSYDDQEIVYDADATDDYALELDVTVDLYESSVFYYNTLLKNSDKSKFVLYLKGGTGTENPERVKLQFADSTYSTSGCTTGLAYCWLSGITTSWKQWIVDLSADMIIAGSFDIDDIREVTLVFENIRTGGDKSVTLYIDELAFFDDTNTLTWYPFHQPQKTIIPDNDMTDDEGNSLYKHTLKDYNDGLTYGNDFKGINSVTGVESGEISQDVTTDEAYDGSYSLAVSVDVSDNSESFAFYNNSLAQNSEKDKFVIFMKGGDGNDNPERIKIQFNDSNWSTSGYQTGSGYCQLSDISSDAWQQWIIDLDKDLTINGSFDVSDIRDVVISLDNEKTGGNKDIVLYVDKMVFFDKTDTLTYYPGYHTYEDVTVDVVTEGVRYLLDDFDGRVIDETTDPNTSETVYYPTDLGFNEFFGFSGAVGGNTNSNLPDASFWISSSEEGKGGESHSMPFSGQLNYAFDNGEQDQYIFYYNLMAVNGYLAMTKDMSNMDVFSIWLKGKANGNPEKIKIEFHDDQYDPSSDLIYAYAHLGNILTNEWSQYWINIDSTSDVLIVGDEFHWNKLEEVVIAFDYGMAKSKSGTLYIDDMMFVDTDQTFVQDSDFDLTKDVGANYSEFLDLVERRTFQYFLECFDPLTGLVYDRIHFVDLATVAGTGFGLTALVVGVERGWITDEDAQEIIGRSLDTLWNTDQGDATYDVSGYKGFFYHFLESETGYRSVPYDCDYVNTKIRDLVELSPVDTALLMAGVITVREYYSETTATHDASTDIVNLCDDLYERVDWDWFLDTSGDTSSNKNYNNFYMAWKPEWITDPSNDKTGFGPSNVAPEYWGHWDNYTDEALLILFLAMGSPTHSIGSDPFYKFNRFEDSTKEHIMSWNGSLFHNFFANLWFDLHGDEGSYTNKVSGDLKDEFGVNWWKNSVNAGIANRDYAIAGVDGMGRTNVSTYHANSWGVSSCEAIPAGLNFRYIGENGAKPSIMTTFYGIHDGNNYQTDGTIPPYGGTSMIGFSGKTGGMPISNIKSLMKNFYQNTQLWTGWYGFRDSYTDDDQIKVDAFWDPDLEEYVDVTADSLYPIYKASYFSIDQGPMLIMMENYRTGLIWETFMSNSNITAAMNKIYTGNLDLNNVSLVTIVDNNNKWLLTGYVMAQDKDFSVKGYIKAKDFLIEDQRDVTFTANNDNTGTDYISLGSGFNVEVGATFKASFGN